MLQPICTSKTKRHVYHGLCASPNDSSVRGYMHDHCMTPSLLGQSPKAKPIEFRGYKESCSEVRRWSSSFQVRTEKLVLHGEAESISAIEMVK
jgi:hypothetical protein